MALFLCLLACASLPSKANGFTERAGWVFEQLANPPVPTRRGDSRYQGELKFVNYLDSLSLQADGILDARVLEIGLKASSRFFLDLTDRGRVSSSQLSDRQQSAALEIARFFPSTSGPYGRLGAELVHFFPINRQWLRLGFTTGQLESPSLPWSFQLTLSMFFSFYGERQWLIARNQISREISRLGNGGTMHLGAFFTWVHRLQSPGKPADVPAASFEHMLFALGPCLSAKSGLGEWNITLPLRLWLDRELFDRTDGSGTRTITSYPSEVTQDISLSWSMLL